MTKIHPIEKRNQYDEFLHKIQQPKMKEFWVVSFGVIQVILVQLEKELMLVS